MSDTDRCEGIRSCLIEFSKELVDSRPMRFDARIVVQIMCFCSHSDTLFAISHYLFDV